MKRKSTGVPDRWLDYSSVGNRLDGTRFIAFKVPLKQALTRQLPSSRAFSHWDLLDALNRQNQEVGLIIDLTNTARYYRLQDVPESLLVVRIRTAGHQVPSNAAILSFKRTVRKFLQDNGDNDLLIGVHCTHGLNRTGYLICRYLIDVDGVDPDQAMQREFLPQLGSPVFNSSRGHDIERQNYVTDLRDGPRRSNEGMDEPELTPQRGQAHQRPGDTSPERDQRDRRDWRDQGDPRDQRDQRDQRDRRDWRGPPPDTWNHRTTHRRHHDDRSGPAPRAPPHPEWSRYPPQNQDRFRYPPQNQDGYRHPPQDRGRFKYPPQNQDRFRYPPQDGGGFRYPPQNQDRFRYPLKDGGGFRYPPQNQDRFRYPPQDRDGFRYPPPEPGWSPACRTQQHRPGPVPPPPPRSLPRYSPNWAAGPDGGEGVSTRPSETSRPTGPSSS
ncbi:RNA/RNP complex-1-interacting phosphatase isoform X2 [Salarias fasciatus]|uniref:RNA/RNP complex-1-interacting phosphatase isoform X2 n=1 Tax=Salarias fasciatus TaxID=181472 RepID=UPI001176DFA8|nr:RNA/RNP complex-1-interacting phosphatase isoform X2 [Salarias fasciatus]